MQDTKYSKGMHSVKQYQDRDVRRRFGTCVLQLHEWHNQCVWQEKLPDARLEKIHRT